MYECPAPMKGLHPGPNLGSGEPAPLRPFLVLGFTMIITLHTFILANFWFTTHAHEHGTARPSTWKAALLTSNELTIIGVQLYILIGNCAQRLKLQELTDWNLLFAVLIPWVDVVLFFTSPSFDVTSRIWSGFFAQMMFWSVSVGELPPGYFLVQWVMTSPPLLFLDYFKTCLPVAAESTLAACMDMGAKAPATYRICLQCGSPDSIASYLANQGALLMVTGLAFAFAMSVLSRQRIVHMPDKSKPGTETAESDETYSPGADGTRSNGCNSQIVIKSSAADEMWPLKTFGLNLEALVLNLQLQPVLDYLMKLVDYLAGTVNITLVLGLVSTPFAVFYFFFALLASRLDHKTISISGVIAEEWVAALSSSLLMGIIMGRESVNQDMTAFLKRMHERLHAPQSIQELIDNVRKQVMDHDGPQVDASGSSAKEQRVERHELLGEGAFGQVFRGLWRGTLVAVKIMLLPKNTSGVDQRQRMAIMEAAISTSLSHPNIVQTFTYSLRPIFDPMPTAATSAPGSTNSPSLAQDPMALRLPSIFAIKGSLPQPSSSSSVGFEVEIVMELCDCGSLRQLLNQGGFTSPTSHQVDYQAVLDTAADIAKGMARLHSLNIMHSDLKSHNVLLRSSGSDARGFIAKIADFGLSIKMKSSETDIVGDHHGGTLSHMAPEAMHEGRMSKAADMYAYGIVLWELLTSWHPYAEVPTALLCCHVVDERRRPLFPPWAPKQYVKLTQRCWDAAPEARPTFEEVICLLRDLQKSLTPADKAADKPSKGVSSAPATFVCSSVIKELRDSETTAERTLRILDQVLVGDKVDASDVISLRNLIISSGKDLHHRPLNLVSKLRDYSEDKDVHQSLMTLLLSPEEAKLALRNDKIIEEGSASRSTDLLSKTYQPGMTAATSSTMSCASSSCEAPELTMLKHPCDQVLLVLAKMDEWHFDPFPLEEVSGGYPLSMLTFAIMTKVQLPPGRRNYLDLNCLARFLRRIEDGYSSDNPYHCKARGADVVHSMYWLMTQGGVLRVGWPDEQGTSMALLVSLLSAVIHGYVHKGVNNDFLVKTEDPLALVYNDTLPMEQHQLSAAFHLLKDDSLNFLKGMPADMKAELRKQVIDAVLATDMKRHFSLVSLFRTKFSRKGLSSSVMLRARSVSIGNAGLGGHETAASPILEDEARCLLLQTCLKCADLGTLSASWPVHRLWVNRLESEMFMQGDREALAGLPISPLMDRVKGGVSKRQAGFFGIVGLPLFEAVCGNFSGCLPLLAGAKANYGKWLEMGKTGDAE